MESFGKRSRKFECTRKWKYLFRNASPTLRTEKDIGSKNPETTAVSGFCYAIFQGGIQKISFPKNDLWGGLELNSTDIKGRFYD